MLTIFAAVLVITSCFAKTHKIKVSNFQFSPATTNAKIGDTIIFVWKSGGHTTTSLALPTGATPWDAQMNSSHTKFKYIVTKAGTYNYDCSIHSSMTGKIQVTAALASGLSDINISTENAKAVLSWQINSNESVAYFSVQRSVDGNNFSEIAKVKADISVSYKYIDETVLTNKYVYYQITLVDKNGDTQLSNIKMAANPKNVSKLITSVSPNPISNPGHLMLQFNADAESKMLVQLYTQGGKLVNQIQMEANKGLNNGHFHLGNLTPGSYYIICTLGDKTEKYPIIYQ